MNKLTPVEFKGQRIITTKVLAGEYGTEENNIKNNFNNNKRRFIEGKHYYKLQGEDLKEFKRLVNDIDEAIKFAPVLYLWTDRGASRHAKILDTDEAWEVYEALEENYFNPKSQIKLSKELQAILFLDEKTQRIENEVNGLKDKVSNMEEKAPLYNIECKELQELVRKIGIKSLGGYKTPAYNNNSLRSKVYSDIQQQLKREFGVRRYEGIKRCQLLKAKEIVQEYIPPTILTDKIVLENNQIHFN